MFIVIKTRRFVASKVTTNERAGGDKDCSLSFRSQPNASTVYSEPFFSPGNSNIIFYCNWSLAGHPLDFTFNK